MLISSPGANANPAGCGCNTAISSNVPGGKKGSHKKTEVINIKTPLSYRGVRVFAHSVVVALDLS